MAPDEPQHNEPDAPTGDAAPESSTHPKRRMLDDEELRVFLANQEQLSRPVIVLDVADDVTRPLVRKEALTDEARSRIVGDIPAEDSQGEPAEAEPYPAAPVAEVAEDSTEPAEVATESAEKTGQPEELEAESAEEPIAEEPIEPEAPDVSEFEVAEADTSDVFDEGVDMSASEEVEEPAASERVELSDPETDETMQAAEAETFDQQDIDALLAGEQVDQPLTDDDMEAVVGADPESIAMEEIEPQEEETAPAADSAEGGVPDDLVDALVAESEEEVGAENFAAAASQTEPEPGAIGEPKAREIPEDDAEDAGEDEAQSESAMSKARAAVFTYIGAHRSKVVTSAAAGLVVFLGTFVFLSLNPFQQGSNGAGALTLQQAMDRAETLMADGDYRNAYELLEEPIQNAEPSSLRIDARYMQLEARYRGLPNQLTDAQGARFHGMVDDLVGDAPQHGRAIDALLWKGDLYQRQDNPGAARRVYRKTLEEYAGSEGLDRVLLAAANLALAEEKSKHAAGFLQQLLSKYPRSAHAGAANLMLGDAYAQAGRSEEARILYVRAADRYNHAPLGNEAITRLGELETELGNYERAISELETRLGNATTVEGNDRVYLALARAYRGAGELENARAILNELLEFFPETEYTPLARVELSRVLEEMGFNEEAVRVARRTVEEYPADSEVLRYAGGVFSRIGDAKEAALAYRAAEGSGANDPELMLAAGKLYRESGDIEAAAEALEALTVRYPRSEQALEGSIELAKVWFDMGRVRKAVDRLENLATAMEGRGRRLPILIALGGFYQQLGMNERAAEVYQQVAAGTNEPAQLARASRALFDAQAWDEGLAVAERVDSAGLDGADAYAFAQAYAGALLQKRETVKALAMMEEARAAYSEARTPDGELRLLRAYLATARTAKARAMVMELRNQAARGEVEPRDVWPAANAWGDFLYERGDYRAAADAYKVTLETAEPSDEAGQWAMYQRGNALAELADFEESLALFEQVAKLGAPWSKEAAAKAKYVRMEQRLRGRTARLEDS